MLTWQASGAVIAYSAFILLPFLWIAATAFKRQIDILTASFWFTPTLRNFERLLLSSDSTFLLNLANSAVSSLAATLVVLGVALLAAYSLVHLALPRWLPPLLLGVTLVFHIVPPITFVGSWYVLFRELGLYNTLTGLTIAYVAANLPLGLWLGVTYAREVPRELLEAAELDCRNQWQVFRRVFVPLMRNGLTAMGLLIFIFVWSDFLIALNLSAKATQTVPVAITTFAQNEQVRYAEMAASSLLAMAPALILLLLGQRYIVAGLLSGSAK